MNPLDRQHMTWPEMAAPSAEQLGAFLLVCTPSTRESWVRAAHSAMDRDSRSFLMNAPDLEDARRELGDAVELLNGVAFDGKSITERELGFLADRLSRLLRSLPVEPTPMAALDDAGTRAIGQQPGRPAEVTPTVRGRGRVR